jgi:trimethylamine--corrinoid protein Co-methyltransferase
MKIRKGLSGGHYQPLTDHDIQKIHAATLKVFAEVGVEVNFTEARELFRDAGADVHEATRIVRVHRELVEELIAMAPSQVRLCGRGENGELDCEIGGEAVYMGTGGTALNVQDP